jgi:hypothetical protein
MAKPSDSTDINGTWTWTWTWIMRASLDFTILYETWNSDLEIL